ncbi:hypothetical protein KF728_02255 [Candidatus Obscuribacterales bacterium]|nr:hypothetical protein [Candidatus Obscuribacterales bacterium]
MNFLAHFGVTPSANNPGCSNENGSVEKSHDLFKRAVDQRLRLDGTRDFKSVEDYEALLRSMISDRNNQRAERVKEEIACMLPLPKGAWDDETREFSVSVNAFSTISINKAIYSVPSRFIGLKLRAQLNHERVKVFYGRHLVSEMRRKEPGERDINYRHIIFHLLRKPRAFRNYQFREELFPRLVFRQAYDVIEKAVPERCDKEYLRILHQAALGEETIVALALQEILAAGEIPNSEDVRALCVKQNIVPDVEVLEPQLNKYDQLLKTKRSRE